VDVSAVLCLLFLLSGAAALIFEALWFRLASLAFGSSVWAGSLVLSSFMGGLALGNAFAGRRGGALARPVRAYAALEAVVGVTGLGLVALLPYGSELLAPLFRPFLDRPLPLNALRLGLAFVLLMVPCTAMGATLPLLVKALRARDASFGAALGRLYGWNTLGGVVGAVAVEMVFVRAFGLLGSALFAAALNLAAAGGALWLERVAFAGRVSAAPAPPPLATRASAFSMRLLAAAGLSGATLLAFEVVWFRFLQLFVFGTGRNFALMLATVLLGITVGALLAGELLLRRPGAARLLPMVALAAAVTATLGYATMKMPVSLGEVVPAQAVLRHVAWLMLPTCVLSGILFTLAGTALQRESGDDVRASARLTLANTLGGMVGAALGGFVLLPVLGMERSFFALALAYVAVALLTLDPWLPPRLRLALAGAGALAGTMIVLFPFGLMERHYLKLLRLSIDAQASLAALREGRTETIQYLRTDFLGEPLVYRMVTNRYSMSSTHDNSQRYMRLFVYWAVAVRPDPERALLISYGVGNTAKAMTEVSSLRSIDVVDISADVLDLAAVPFPPPAVSPLRDPRVRVHVEDGRFFLQATDQRFDLITAEPPPLKVAGVVSLYTQEYFGHMARRLAPGGVATYWLPVYQLLPHETRAVVRGFCQAFPDCTLWNASGLEWMLAGSSGPPRAVDEERFARAWSDPVIGPQLRAIGVESPEQLGATFLADADQLREWLGPGDALVDDRPQRITNSSRREVVEYVRFMAAAAARERFARSRWVAAVWPPALRARTDAQFTWQRIVNGQLLSVYEPAARPGLDALRSVLQRPDLRTLSAWLLDSSPREQAILEDAVARGATALPAGPMAVRSLLAGDHAAAAPLLEAAARGEPGGRWDQLRPLNALLAGDPVEARRLSASLRAKDAAFARWADENLPADGAH
jgi:spermidine synthase